MTLFKSLRFFFENTTLLSLEKKIKFPERAIFPEDLNKKKPCSFEVLDTERILVLLDYLNFFSIDFTLPENKKVFYNLPFKKKRHIILFFSIIILFLHLVLHSRKNSFNSTNSVNIYL